jgi:hypothetical protein
MAGLTEKPAPACSDGGKCDARSGPIADAGEERRSIRLSGLGDGRPRAARMATIRARPSHREVPGDERQLRHELLAEQHDDDDADRTQAGSPAGVHLS